MKNDFTQTNLFACPIYKIRVDPNSYDKEEILKDIKYNKSLKNTRNDSHQNISGISDIHHSYNDHDNENFRIINYEKLIGTYSEILQDFFNNEIHTTKKYRFNFDIVNYSAITEGQWMNAHNHIPDDFATTHYLNFKKDHIHTCFHNPINFTPFLKFIQPELYNILWNDEGGENSYFEENFYFPVEEDDMLIFPAALNHQIMTQWPTKEPRITISANIKILSA